MISLWKKMRRSRLVSGPFPKAWKEILERNVEVYPHLSDAEREKLHDDIRILVAEKRWEGCRGFQITDEVKVTIAAQAALMLLGRNDHDYFSRLLSILVYPSSFQEAESEWREDRQLPRTPVSGLSVYRGPVILAWDAVLRDGRDSVYGNNLVIHEFAHQLDDLDHRGNGTPALETEEEVENWARVMSAEYEQLQDDVRCGRETFLGDYAATRESEFFAVATERFFTLPEQLAKIHPGIYELLRDYYRVDPLEWSPGHADAAEEGRLLYA